MLADTIKHRIRQKSLKLNKALEVLNYYTNKDVIEHSKKIYLNTYNKELKLSEGYFSKYKKVLNKDEYLPPIISEKVMDFLVDSLNDFVREKEKMIWDTSSGQYIKKDLSQFKFASNESHFSQHSDNRLMTISGVFKGYYWNSLKKDIDTLKLLIKEDGKVICATSKKTFNDGNISMIGSNKVSITLKATDWLINFTGKVGVRDDYSTLRYINMVYCDTGDDEVQCGSLVLERTNERYEDITIETINFSKDNNLDEFLINVFNSTIKDTNIVVKFYE